jgi:light-regulated signal transduction histidine kinase (bacteriophytochrome)
MRAKKGEWFSLKWEPKDYHCKEAYLQLKQCPVFVCPEKDTNSISCDLESAYPKLSLVAIKRTSMFISLKNGIKVPTHYQIGMLMPGEDLKYDVWLQSYFNIDDEVSEQIKNKNLLQQKSIYLEHTAKIIRHDMHSGINTYIPRGLSILLDKIPEEVVKEYKLGLGLRLLEEGLKHSQKVYKGVYEFTNLVKRKPEFNVENCDVAFILKEHLESTSYKDKVNVNNLCSIGVNSTLFTIAVDNFIKNGIKYNNSSVPKIDIYLNNNNEIVIQDNGVGMSQMEYDMQCMPYMREEVGDEKPQGLGINIANSILEEHGFKITVEELESGTAVKIRVK